jgi:DNA-binding GntR family transcriptional regulator
VRELTADEVRESAQVRHALETAGVQLADAHARSQLGPRLAESLDQQERALRSGDFPTFATSALGFHRAFVELSKNTIMLSFYDRLRDRQYFSIVRSAPTLTHDPERILAEHRALLGDAQSGDWVAFSTHLRAHQSNAHDLE